MAVIGKPHGASDVHGDGGIHFCGGCGIEHFGARAQGVSHGGHGSFFVESMLRLAQHQQAFLCEAEVTFLREFGKQSAALQVEIEQKLLAGLDVA